MGLKEFYAQNSGANAPNSERQTAVFTQIPSGKRLILEHLSVYMLVGNADKEQVQAKCYISGNGLDVNGNSQAVAHIIPLSSREDFTDMKESFTGGQQLTMYLEAGSITLSCSSGVVSYYVSQMEGYISGQLVSAP